MEESRGTGPWLLCVLVAAASVYVFAHWSAITSPYVINDDVRQQIYWMQQWRDPALYRGDLLTNYARSYVPWGVKVVYAAAGQMVDPLVFSKVLTGLLFVATAGLLFLLGEEVADQATGLLAVSVMFMFADFLGRISGGLPRSFAYPLLIGYILCLVRGRPAAAGVVLLLQALFIPYVFLISLVTHVFYTAHVHGRTVIRRPRSQPTTGGAGSPLAGDDPLQGGRASGLPSASPGTPVGNDQPDREVPTPGPAAILPGPKAAGPDPPPSLADPEAVFPEPGATRASLEATNSYPVEAHSHPAAVHREPAPAPQAPGVHRLSGIFAAVTAAAAVAAAALQYVVFRHPVFGELVTRADMAGKVEYGAAGRYEILPEPSVFDELLRFWVTNLHYHEWGPAAGWITAAVLTAVILYALGVLWSRPEYRRRLEGLRVLGYLLAASIVLYVLARLFLLKLFIPGRYLEYPLNVCCCVGTAVCLRIAIERAGWKPPAVPVLAAALVLFGALRLHNVELYDYSAHRDLYRFARNTPKQCLMAGHPKIMDNILTFSRRKAFVTYELSHPWIKPYWALIKDRTLALFAAYYTEDPGEIHRFAHRYGIDYLIVREADFSPERLAAGPIYFEPFGELIRRRYKAATHFAVLDREAFPPIYERAGIRVLRLDRPPARDGSRDSGPDAFPAPAEAQ